MRFFSAVLPLSGEFRWEKGIKVAHDPFEHILVGERTKTRKPVQIWIMEGLKKTLSVKEMTPCPREGKPESATLGVCPTCRVEVTAKGIFSVPDGTQKVGDKEIPLVKHLHKHKPLVKYDRVFRGSIVRSKVKKSLLAVEEFQSDRHGKAALFISAEAPVRGASQITLPSAPCSDLVLDLIHGDAWGERWASPNGKMGIGMERIIVLKPGQSFRIDREGELGGAPAHFLITLQRDFTFSARPMSDAEVIAMGDKADMEAEKQAEADFNAMVEAAKTKIPTETGSDEETEEKTLETPVTPEQVKTADDLIGAKKEAFETYEEDEAAHNPS